MSDFVFVAVPPQSSVEVLLDSASRPTGAAIIDPHSPGMEFSALLSRKSFLEDILRKSFSSVMRSHRGVCGAKPPQPSTAASDNNDDEDFVLVPHQTSPSGKKGPQPRPASPPTTPTSTTTTPTSTTTTVTINAHQWERTLRQFGLDINRQCFVVNGQRYTDSDCAITAVHDYLRHLLQRGGSFNPYLQRFYKRSDNDCGGISNTAKTPSNNSNAQQQQPRTPRMCDNTANSSASWLWFAFPSSTSSSPQVCVSNVPSSARNDASLIEDIVQQLTREVLLVSQQSVMGFPLELLTHCVNKASGGSMDAPEWYVGEVRDNEKTKQQQQRRMNQQTGCLGSSEEERGGVRSRESIMRIELGEGRQKAEGDVVAPAPYEASCGFGVGGILSSLIGKMTPKKNAASRSNEGTHAVPSITTASLVPTLCITKLLRVFSIDMDVGRDVTQFHIRATLEVSLFGGEEDPVQLTWCVVKEDYDEEGDDRHEPNVVGSDGVHPMHVVTPQPPAPVDAGAPPATPSGAADSAPVDEVGATSTRCQCLGASAGFHRKDCECQPV
ncbi:Hypothetical protein, putative [Bodo saltans]|uniref:Uncharacterized protein n=1 Tax=Bodo saltans TaxID=75058 RepID=A0A0S4IMN5_BODSA|nr:Hypothetical protein, putative [Bodo saltans]|eukprot:CUE74436.1 Hypothetical protein, putative [Bodo saltans]